VSPIISDKCLPCHFSGNTLSSIALSDQAHVKSQLSMALTQVYHCNMPPSDAPGLTSDERQSLLRYLVCGAPNN